MPRPSVTRERDILPQNATPDALPPAQLAALTALLSGHSVTDAAAIANVDRSTLYRWLREPVFLAAYNQGRADLLAASQTRLLALAEHAVALVAAAIDQDRDVKTALAVLRGLGALSGSLAIGPTDPQAVEDAQVAERLKVGERALNRVLAGLGDG
jgi:transposase-like protein